MVTVSGNKEIKALFASQNYNLLGPRQTFGLESLSTREASDAADAAFASKRRSLRICRYFGELLERERMAGDQQCYGCGTHVFGAVY